MNPVNSHARILSSPKACTDCTTPERVMNVPKIVKKNVTMTSVTFHTRSMPRRSWTMTECRNAVAVNHGSRPAFSTGSQPQKPPQPSSSYAHNMPSVRPNERNSQPIIVPRRTQPCVVEIAGHERGDAERVRDRHRDEARVERRRMDRHVEVLQERVET